MDVADILSMGNPRSLGRTGEVVSIVLARPPLLDEVFACLSINDPTIRMRAGDALEKICRRRPELFRPYVKRLFGEMAAIGQSSVRWHLAQILGEVQLKPSEKRQAVKLLKKNLAESSDKIVLNYSMQTLADFAAENNGLRAELIPVLQSYSASSYKSLSSRATRLLNKFTAAAH